MKLLVLAAGYATRLRPLTDNQAKPLLPVAGRPMLEHVLEKFADCPAIDAIYIVTNHRFAPNFQSWAEAHGGAFAGRPVQVIDDGTLSNDDRLGAIGDIHYVIHKAALDDDLIVVAGDNLFSGDLTEYVAAAQHKGILVGAYDVKDLEQIKRYNNLQLDTDGKILFFEEKPQVPISTLTAIALYYYPQKTLSLINQYISEGNNPDQPGRLIQWLYPRVACYTYMIKGQWLDIGSLETYEQAQQLFGGAA